MSTFENERNNRGTSVAEHHPLVGLDEQIAELRETGVYFFQRGWSVGTSSNYSVILDRGPCELLVTASGKDKGRLTERDFVRVGQDGTPVVPNQPKSSAETLLHCVVAQELEVGAILHTHSVWATLLSNLYFSEGAVKLEGYEMLKGLAGVDTHEHRVRLEIFENTQDIPILAEQVRKRLNDPANPLRYGYLIRRHGMYTWGRDLEEARRHIEVLEFLLECEGRRLMLEGSVSRNVST
ncbi:MAG: methylthioribulose 1-phosphate dehydratase [Planctomycetales bacterium]|nr:methylthioribulose 1-phosphate dehydratase [Planctomycetales bacterium]